MNQDEVVYITIDDILEQTYQLSRIIEESIETQQIDEINIVYNANDSTVLGELLLIYLDILGYKVNIYQVNYSFNDEIIVNNDLSARAIETLTQSMESNNITIYVETQANSGETLNFALQRFNEEFAEYEDRIVAAVLHRLPQYLADNPDNLDEFIMYFAQDYLPDSWSQDMQVIYPWEKTNNPRDSFDEQLFNLLDDKVSLAPLRKYLRKLVFDKLID